MTARIGWGFIGASNIAREHMVGAVRDAARLAEPRVPAKGGTGLTARQAQIADLVAQGEINRTIAARLHISEHTVEHHLTGIFARLGVKSRAQLIALWLASPR